MEILEMMLAQLPNLGGLVWLAYNLKDEIKAYRLDIDEQNKRYHELVQALLKTGELSRQQADKLSENSRRE